MDKPSDEPKQEIFTFVIRRSIFFPIVYIIITQISVVVAMFMLKNFVDFLIHDLQVDISKGDFTMWSTFFLQILNIFVILYIVFDWLYTYYIIRPHQVIYRKGVIMEQRVDYRFERIKKIDIKQGYFAKLLGFGNLYISAGGVQEQATFYDIPQPRKYAKIIIKRASHSFDPKTKPYYVSGN